MVRVSPYGWWVPPASGGAGGLFTYTLGDRALSYRIVGPAEAFEYLTVHKWQQLHEQSVNKQVES